MFLEKSKKEEVTVVTTKKELNEAVKMKKPCIEVQGDLAKQVKWIKKLTPAKTAALIALLSAAAIPSPVAPISAVVATAAVVEITGAEIATIILTAGLSATMILGVLKNYDIEFSKSGIKLNRK